MKGPSPVRLERAWILASSAPLPADARVRSRRRRLERWHLKNAARADVLFVRHPKSGGTWLRALLTRLYARRYGLPDDRLVRADELSRARAGLPRLLTTSGALSWERSLAERIADDPVLRGKRLLYMARHPIDVATSWYNQLTKRTSAFKREMIRAELREPPAPDIGRFEFALHPELGLPRVIEIHNTWVRIAREHPASLVLRYEDLLADTPAALGRVTGFLGERFGEDELRDAADFGSVENLRRLEHENYFKSRSLRMTDPGDPERWKVRRARAGGYREDFAPEEVRVLEALLRERVDPATGYAGGDLQATA